MVKDTIRFMDEFDLTNSSITWDDAKAALVRLYGSYDKPTEYTEEELREFCREQSAKSSFIKSSNVENYYRDFVAISASLKKNGTISDKAVQYYFVMGLPQSMKEWFLAAIPADNRT